MLHYIYNMLYNMMMMMMMMMMSPMSNSSEPQSAIDLGAAALQCDEDILADRLLVRGVAQERLNGRGAAGLNPDP